MARRFSIKNIFVFMVRFMLISIIMLTRSWAVNDHFSSGTANNYFINVNNALNFDGTNDYVHCTNPVSYRVYNGTVEAWIKTSNPGNGVRGVVVKQGAFALQVNDNILSTYDYTSQAFYSTGVNVADGAWHHIAMSFNSGISNETKIYLDGVLILSATITVKNQVNPLMIGAGNHVGAQSINATIDEIRVWNTVRTQSEIQANMGGELAGNEPGLVAYYKLNQGVAGGNNAGITSATATTGVNGTLNNFALTGSTSNWVEGFEAALPVELTEFRARLIGEKITLDWQTISETGNRGFYVQRSQDGKYWETLGFLDGYGTSVLSHSYSFTDENPLNSVNYYRLRQIDFSGEETLSKVISVDNRINTVVQVYPNPARNEVNILLENNLKAGHVEGYHLNGKRVFYRDLTGASGKSTLLLNHLPAGTYLLKFQLDEQLFTRIIHIE